MRKLRSCTSLKFASTHKRVQRNHGHERLTRLDVLAQLHAALRHIAGDRRHDRIALRGDPGIAVRRLRLQHGRVVSRPRAVDQRMRRDSD